MKEWPYDLKRALEKESSAHAKAETFDVQEIIEHDDIEDGNAQVAQLRLIHRLKNQELGPMRATKSTLKRTGLNSEAKRRRSIDPGEGRGTARVSRRLYKSCG
ncbi:hypothetical protein FVE85_4800 [Porphyridium purpureum]|uniref:Uncharacterized protein n=1 Tax=Porphyridium purpureum TaxID=35688 RepID=A0A5J4YS74_PORPP|nr:hypothetical protein FVE85_4800 [Porphyridium purpureum]|eukprot:POR2144..scf236_6